MNILIVDDNKNNRMILRLLLEDYMDENEGVHFDIDEAEDGQVAVDKCSECAFDIVLMDIMMPVMDGIQATKIIRDRCPKSMIIAVSAVDDGERQKLILDSGAEDYIPKPINVDIFVNRLANYIVLIEARNHKKNVQESYNLFSKEIFSRHTNFIMKNDDGVAELWEFFLLNARKKSDNLSDIIRSITTIVEKQLQLGNKENCLYIEESDDKQFFTLTNIDQFPAKIIELILLKNNVKRDYKLEGDKLSFEILKIDQFEEKEEELPVAAPVVEAPAVEAPAVEVLSATPIQEEVIASSVNVTASKSLEVFDYMDEEDLIDLEEYAGKLNSIMLIVGGGDVTEEEVVDIYSYLDKIGSVLSPYSEVYSISKALSELSVDMSTYTQEFIDNSEALGPMCKAFSNDMSKWIEQSFHTGAPSADFMNDTIVVNCQTISGMLKMNDVAADGGDDGFDDIFDF